MRAPVAVEVVDGPACPAMMSVCGQAGLLDIVKLLETPPSHEPIGVYCLGVLLHRYKRQSSLPFQQNHHHLQPADMTW